MRPKDTTMNKKLFRAGNICFLSLFVATAPAVAEITGNTSDAVTQSITTAVGNINWVNFGDSFQHVVPETPQGIIPPQVVPPSEFSVPQGGGQGGQGQGGQGQGGQGQGGQGGQGQGGQGQGDQGQGDQGQGGQQGNGKKNK